MRIKTKVTREPKDDPQPYHRVQKGDVRNIEVLSKEFCCKNMEDAMSDDFIIFGDDDWLNKDNNLNLIHTSCYPSGTVIDYKSISFCPFCGARVKIEEILYS